MLALLIFSTFLTSAVAHRTMHPFGLARSFLEQHQLEKDGNPRNNNFLYGSSCQMGVEGTISCTICHSDGSYCVTETCRYEDADETEKASRSPLQQIYFDIMGEPKEPLRMTCESCATDDETGNESCLNIFCDLGSETSSFANSCRCSSASYNGDTCSKCGHCSKQKEFFSTGVAGMELKCPYVGSVACEEGSKRHLSEAPGSWSLAALSGYMLAFSIFVVLAVFRRPKQSTDEDIFQRDRIAESFAFHDVERSTR